MHAEKPDERAQAETGRDHKGPGGGDERGLHLGQV